MAIKLRIGEIPYANLFPIFYTLKKEFDCSAYEFTEGPPSMLNSMLRAGGVDVSPSSSIEYLRNPSLYRLIDGHSISSRGEVGSILLFSGKPLEQLGGGTIHVSSQSETSVGLLKIILEKFSGLPNELHVSEKPGPSDGHAFLLIGDDALKYRAAEQQSSKGTVPALMIYDLGDLWFKNTGLPFVFALWIARAELYKDEKRRELLERFVADLDKAKEVALCNLPEIARHSPMKSFMTENEILSYWNKLDYELTYEHKKGLELFNKYLKEMAYQ